MRLFCHPIVLQVAPSGVARGGQGGAIAPGRRREGGAAGAPSCAGLAVASKGSTGGRGAKMRKVRLKSGRTHGDKTDHK